MVLRGGRIVKGTEETGRELKGTAMFSSSTTLGQSGVPPHRGAPRSPAQGGFPGLRQLPFWGPGSVGHSRGEAEWQGRLQEGAVCLHPGEGVPQGQDTALGLRKRRVW